MSEKAGSASKDVVRTPLSPELIVITAMEIIDREGLDGLTMRRLARELGVAATAIYWHLHTRDEILQGVYDLAVSKVEMSVSSGDSWIERVKSFSRAVRDMHRSHPFMFSLAQKFGGRGAERTINSIVATAPKNEYSIQAAVQIAWIFQVFAIGFAFVETSTTAMLADEDTQIPQLLDEIGSKISSKLLSSLIIRYAINSDELFEIVLESLAQDLPETLELRQSREGRTPQAGEGDNAF